MRTLKYGCKGNDVKWYQYKLNEALHEIYGEKYIPIEVDGKFGGVTEMRTKMYQGIVGLKADGKVGPLTKSKLGLTDFAVWIIDPKKDKLWIAGTPYGSEVYPLKTLERWAKEEGADYVWNLAFFNTTDKGKKTDQYGTIKGRTLTYVKSKGKDVGYGGTPEKITLSPGNVCAGDKLAVKDGKKKTVSSVVKRARNANGILKDGRIFIVQSVTKQTESAVVNHMMNNYDVDLMLIQDSGGSTGFYDAKNDVLIAAECEGKNGRPVATALCMKRGM